MCMKAYILMIWSFSSAFSWKLSADPYKQDIGGQCTSGVLWDQAHVCYFCGGDSARRLLMKKTTQGLSTKPRWDIYIDAQSYFTCKWKKLR